MLKLFITISQSEINCTFIDINLKNYSLNCKINEDMKGDFQTAISFIDDNILIIYFDSLNQSIIKEAPTKESFKYFINKNGGSAGMIVAIIVVIIVCIGAVIATFIILKKKNVKQHIRDKSTNNAFI